MVNIYIFFKCIILCTLTQFYSTLTSNFTFRQSALVDYNNATVAVVVFYSRNYLLRFDSFYIPNSLSSIFDYFFSIYHWHTNHYDRGGIKNKKTIIYAICIYIYIYIEPC
jgi:hypothetical protein